MSYERVEHCRRCGLPAEGPAVGCGQVVGQQEEHLPICVQCIELLLADPRAFWARFKKKE